MKRFIIFLMLFLLACGVDHDNPLDPAKSNVPQPRVIEFTTQTTPKGIKLTWLPDSRAHKYNIYRSLSENQGYGNKPIKEKVEGDSYVDETALKADIYYYKVVPLYQIVGQPKNLEGSVIKAPPEFGIPPAKIVKLEIKGEDILMAGITYSFSTVGQNVHGKAVPILPEWRVEPIASGEMKKEGVLTATKSGEIEIIATFLNITEKKKLVVEPKIPTLIKIISRQSQEGIVNTTLAKPLILKVLDAFNNGVPDIPIDVEISGPATAVLSPEKPYKTDNKGRLTVRLTLGEKIGEYEVKATLQENPDITATLKAYALPDQVDQILVESPGVQTVRPGQEVSIKATLFDQYKNPIEGKTVTFRAEDATLTSTRPITNRQGKAETTLTAWTRIGSYFVMVESESISRKIDIRVIDGPAENLRKALNAPSAGTVGETLILSVEVTDEYENPVKGVSVSFKGGEGGRLQETNVRTNESGIATASFTLGSKAKEYIVRAESPGLKGSPVEFRIAAHPGPPVKISLLPIGDRTGVVTQSFSAPLTVQVKDVNENPVSNIPVNFTIDEVPDTSRGYKLSRYTVYTGRDGKASSSFTFGDKTGDYQISAHAIGEELSEDLSTEFNLYAVAGPAEQIKKVKGDAQQKTVTRTLDIPLVVKVFDAHDNAVSGVDVNFNINVVPQNSTGHRLSESIVKTNPDGTASTQLTFGDKAGSYQVWASAKRLDGSPLSGSPVKFTDLTAKPDKPYNIYKISGDGQIGKSSTLLNMPLQVEVTDQFDNLVPGASVSFTITKAPEGASGASVSATKAKAGNDGRIQVKFMVGDKDGDYEVTASLTNKREKFVIFQATVLPGPKPFISPQILDFGDTESTMTLTISKTGKGILNWKIMEDIPWVTKIEPSKGELTDTYEKEEVGVSVSREGLPPSGELPYRGEITISSDGNKPIHLTVTITVKRDVTVIVTDVRTMKNIKDASVILNAMPEKKTNDLGEVIFKDFKESGDLPLEVSYGGFISRYIHFKGNVNIPPSGDYELPISLKTIRSVKGQITHFDFNVPNYVVFSPDSGRAYVTNERGNSVSVINVRDDKVFAKVNVGKAPLGIVYNPKRMEVYVANSGSDDVSVIDTQKLKEIKKIDVGNNPTSLAVSSSGDLLYVVNHLRRPGGNTDGDVSVIDLNRRVETDVIPVGNKPYGVVITPDDNILYVSNKKDGTVSIVDVWVKRQLSTISVGSNPMDVVISSDGRFVYVSNSGGSTVSMINTISKKVRDFDVGAIPRGIAVTDDFPDGDILYVVIHSNSTVSVVDVSAGIVVKEVVRGFSFPLGIATTNDGTKMYVTNREANSVSVLEFE